MERIELQYTGSKTARNRALSGVVGSGDMEALFEPGKGNKLSVSIKTSVDGSTPRWATPFRSDFHHRQPAVGKTGHPRLRCHARRCRLRIEQVFEEASHD